MHREPIERMYDAYAIRSLREPPTDTDRTDAAMARVITLEERTYVAPNDASLTLASCEVECSRVIAEYIASFEREREEREERERMERYVRNAPRIIRTLKLTRDVSNYGREGGTYRDITKRVQNSATLIGDRTQNGNVRHKLSGTYRPVATTYVLSDTLRANVATGESSVRRKSSGTPLLRDANGNVDTGASATLASLIGAKRQNR